MRLVVVVMMVPRAPTVVASGAGMARVKMRVFEPLTPDPLLCVARRALALLVVPALMLSRDDGGLTRKAFRRRSRSVAAACWASLGPVNFMARGGAAAVVVVVERLEVDVAMRPEAPSRRAMAFICGSGVDESLCACAWMGQWRLITLADLSLKDSIMVIDPQRGSAAAFFFWQAARTNEPPPSSSQPTAQQRPAAVRINLKRARPIDRSINRSIAGGAADCGKKKKPNNQPKTKKDNQRRELSGSIAQASARAARLKKNQKRLI